MGHPRDHAGKALRHERDEPHGEAGGEPAHDAVARCRGFGERHQLLRDPTRGAVKKKKGTRPVVTGRIRAMSFFRSFSPGRRRALFSFRRACSTRPQSLHPCSSCFS